MRHPHADATYRVIQVEDASFAVEVSIPETNPTTVRPFASEAAAEAWILEHRQTVESQIQNGRLHRRPGGQLRRAQPATRIDPSS